MKDLGSIVGFINEMSANIKGIGVVPKYVYMNAYTYKYLKTEVFSKLGVSPAPKGELKNINGLEIVITPLFNNWRIWITPTLIEDMSFS